MTQQELENFSRFINQSVKVARQIIEQEATDLARYGEPDVHDGYNYRSQAWVA